MNNEIDILAQAVAKEAKKGAGEQWAIYNVDIRSAIVMTSAVMFMCKPSATKLYTVDNIDTAALLYIYRVACQIADVDNKNLS